jgi:transposase
MLDLDAQLTWACTGLTDIHHEGRGPGKDAQHYGDRERKKPRPRRSFTSEFKADIVERCRCRRPHDRPGGADFDLTETAVREWVRQAEVDAGERPGPTSAEREELVELRRENRRLREDVDILRRATTTGRCR